MKKIQTLLLLLSIALNAVSKNNNGNIFPDGTPISEWFLQDDIVSLDSLGEIFNISRYGAISDPNLIQTEKIQKTIDEAAANGGGVVYIPEGIYKSGALFFKQGTHLYLTAGAVLLGSGDILDFPLMQTRIEGEICKYFSALINADKLNGFTISGKGTIDGNGTHYWKAFRLRMQWNPKATNKDEMRPRLVYVSNCRNIQISGVTLQNSPFWTSHFYKCDSVKLLNLRYFSPAAPVLSASTDAIDIDVCGNFLIKGCHLTANDDAICFKGGKGPYADKDPNNGTNKNILVEECVFETTASCMTCGSESVHAYNILMRNCHVKKAVELLYLKMRPDTPQHYEYITIENISGSCKTFFLVFSWRQYFNLKDRPDIPKSYADHITLRNIDLKCDRFLNLKKNEKEYELSDFYFENLTIKAKHTSFDKDAVVNFRMKNVTVNGQKMTVK